jgi:hypothetical protein
MVERNRDVRARLTTGNAESWSLVPDGEIFVRATG